MMYAITPELGLEIWTFYLFAHGGGLEIRHVAVDTKDHLDLRFYELLTRFECP